MSIEDTFMLEPDMFVSRAAGNALINSLRRRDFGSSSAASSAPVAIPGAAPWQPSARETKIFKECRVRMQKWAQTQYTKRKGSTKRKGNNRKKERKKET